MFFISAFQDFQNSIPWGPPLYFLLVCKIHAKFIDDTFKSLHKIS